MTLSKRIFEFASMSITLAPRTSGKRVAAPSFDIPKDQGLEEKYKDRPELLVPQEARDAAAIDRRAPSAAN